MAKKKTPTFLAPKKILGEEEYEKYKKLRTDLRKRELRQEIKQLKKRSAYEKLQGRYAKTPTGKFGGVLTKVFGVGRRGVTRSLYARKMASAGSTSGIRTGKRGRPRASFDPRYVRFGGVYGYRKAMALQRFKEKQQILQQSAFAPQNLEVMRQIQARQQMESMAPERRTIPDTAGAIPLKGIFDEINDSSNLVP